MADTFKIIDYLTRNPEQLANMLTTDADVDVMKLSAALANMLQEIQMLDHQLLQLRAGMTAEDVAEG